VTVNVPAAAAPPKPAPAPPPPTVDPLAVFNKNVVPILFDYDKADIRPSELGKIQNNAAWLKANPAVRFTIDGHADERGSQEYNLALADRRANAVRSALSTQGVSDNRMTTVSFGEERPDCRAQTEECFQTNRRAAFTMLR
jgi:peptidoglycan-associated lipoprotein